MYVVEISPDEPVADLEAKGFKVHGPVRLGREKLLTVKATGKIS